jgi:DNA-binding CsgD family transcriptional regulator
VAAARSSADELARCAAVLNTPLVLAMACRASGAVLLAEGDPRGACQPLQEWWRLWQELDVPYEAARVQALLGAAFQELGDTDSAGLQFVAAAAVFRRLGAVPDLARLPSAGAAAVTGGLTDREAEVLGLAAEGRTNREIAAQLVLSEHTVRRHLQNIFAKLGVSSRAAATRVWVSSRPHEFLPRGS